MRIDPFLEKIAAPSDQLFTLRDFRMPYCAFRWHYHPEIELTLIRRGRGLRYVGHSVESFEKGDLCLLEGNLPHSWSSPRGGGALRSMVIQFLPDTGGADFWKLRELRTVTRMLRSCHGGWRVEGPLRERVAERMILLDRLPMTSPRRVSLFIELLEDLASGRGLRRLHPGRNAPPARTSDRIQALLQRVLNHVENHSGREIVHRDIAQLIRLSPPAFCRFFKREMGKTFSDHINDVRLARACSDLSDTDRRVIDIAFACGYGNLSHFNRRFRAAFHCTPRDYRRRLSQQTLS